MMGSKGVFRVMLSVVTILAFTLAAEARPYGPGFRDHGPAGKWGRLEAFLELKLSDSQQEQMKGILARYKDQRRNLRGSLKDARKNMRSVLGAAVFNEEDVRKAFQQLSSVRGELFLCRARMMAELRGVLNPEQLQMLKERLEIRKKRLEAFENLQAE